MDKWHERMLFSAITEMTDRRKIVVFGSTRRFDMKNLSLATTAMAAATGGSDAVADI